MVGGYRHSHEAVDLLNLVRLRIQRAGCASLQNCGKDRQLPGSSLKEEGGGANSLMGCSCKTAWRSLGSLKKGVASLK